MLFKMFAMARAIITHARLVLSKKVISFRITIPERTNEAMGKDFLFIKKLYIDIIGWFFMHIFHTQIKIF